MLVIEDISFSALLVKRFLEDQGHEVLMAKDGHEGLTFLEEEDGIDCVICDLFLPDMDGFQVYQACQKIKRYNKYSIVQTPPFILLTSSNNPDHFREAQVMGFVAALPKPFAPKEFLSILNDLAATESATPEDQHLADKPKILVVDALGQNHRTLKEIYADSEYQIIWMTAGYRCLEYLEQQHRLQLLITDYQFPDMSIEELLDLAEQCGQGGAMPPFVLMTEAANTQQLSDKLRSRFAEVLPLPMNPFELKQKLGRVLHGGNSDADRLTQNTVLIVDDLNFNTSLVKNILKHSSLLTNLGCRYITASSAMEALRILQSDYTVFLVITDLIMPCMDGLEMLREYKQFIASNDYLNSDAFQKPQFILATGTVTPGLVQEAKQTGYVEVFEKPFQTEPLLEKVHEIVNSAHLGQFAGSADPLHRMKETLQESA